MKSHRAFYKVSPVLAACLFMTAAVYLGNVEAGQGGPKTSERKPLTVYERVDSWTLRTLNGKKIPFSEFKGRIVFLNFWATWCVPCVEEMASIQKLYNVMKGDDMVFLLVTDEKERKVRTFLQKQQLTVPIYLRNKKLPKVFRTRRLPVTYIVDCEGNIAYRRTGSAQWDDPACQDLIRGLMPKKTPSS